jgi:hypothetical protein
MSWQEFDLASYCEVGISIFAAVIQAFPDLHVGVVGILAIHDPAWAMIVRAGAAGLLTTVDQDIYIRFGVVVDTMGSKGR